MKATVVALQNRSAEIRAEEEATYRRLHGKRLPDVELLRSRGFVVTKVKGGRYRVDTQRAALKALADHGGEGVRTNRMTLLAAGAELGHGPDGEGDGEWHQFFAWSPTWLSLLKSGHIEEMARRRYRLTDIGRAAVSA